MENSKQEIRAMLYTDASIFNYTKTGGYAFLYFDGKNTFGHSDVLPKEVTEKKMNVSIGELYAICKGVKITHEKTGANLIFVRTDSQKALNWIIGKNTRLPFEAKKLIEWLEEYRKRYGISLKIKKVKAHSDEKGKTDTQMNDWCDKAANRKGKAEHIKKLREMIGKSFKHQSRSVQETVVVRAIREYDIIVSPEGKQHPRRSLKYNFFFKHYIKQSPNRSRRRNNRKRRSK